MKIYISGPITNRSSEEVMRFWEADIIINTGGHTCVNPACMSYWELSWKTYMQIASDIIESGDVDVMYMMEGWQESAGSKLERDIALSNNIPVVYQSGADRRMYGGLVK